MTEYTFFSGKFIDSNKALIPIKTHAFLYGTSIFEGLRAYYNKDENQLYIFRMKEHYDRLNRSAKIMMMSNPYSDGELYKINIELLKKNNYRQDVYIRPVLYKSTESIGPSLHDKKDEYLVFSLPFGDYFDTPELNVCVSSWRRNSDNTIPPRAKIAGAYVNASLIKTDAHNFGFDDAITLSESGHVAEGSAMNMIFIRDGKLITTTSTDDILVGVTRNTVLQLAQDIGIEVVERPVDRTELYIMDEIFACGTGAQIMAVTSVDKRPVGNGKTGEITSQLQKLYYDVVHGKVAKYKDWCTAVYD